MQQSQCKAQSHERASTLDLEVTFALGWDLGLNLDLGLGRGRGFRSLTWISNVGLGIRTWNLDSERET